MVIYKPSVNLLFNYLKNVFNSSIGSITTKHQKLVMSVRVVCLPSYQLLHFPRSSTKPIFCRYEVGNTCYRQKLTTNCYYFSLSRMEVVSDALENEEENLITQIEQEMRKIYLSVEKLHNNASLSEITDPVEKCFINNYYYSSCLVERGLNDGLDRSEDALRAFEESLQRELDCLTSDMDRLIMKMNEYKEQFNSIERNISNINAMMEAQKNETKSEKKLDSVLKHIKMRFRKEKSDLKMIVANLFPDSLEIQDLIARIVDHHFEEGTDKYVQLEDSDNITEQIELLRRTRLFETNPHDPLQIRLADLV